MFAHAMNEIHYDSYFLFVIVEVLRDRCRIFGFRL